jgi:hypothetical protein
MAVLPGIDILLQERLDLITGRSNWPYTCSLRSKPYTLTISPGERTMLIDWWEQIRYVWPSTAVNPATRLWPVG